MDPPVDQAGMGLPNTSGQDRDYETKGQQSLRGSELESELNAAALVKLRYT